MNNIYIIEKTIPVKIYQNLRIVCGLSAKTDEACKVGLKNSVHSVMIKEQHRIIGMGRIIGDGGCFCQIVDICVLPEKQGQGIGKLIMQSLINFIQTKLPPSCYVSLIADGDAAYLYEKFGFSDTLPVSKGMYLNR
ncbi:GNAT family N-acetyltransferase [Flavobacteriaceae bacterium M23B6Z8]